jgi:hypothetical protein
MTGRQKQRNKMRRLVEEHTASNVVRRSQFWASYGDDESFEEHGEEMKKQSRHVGQ